MIRWRVEYSAIMLSIVVGLLLTISHPNFAKAQCDSDLWDCDNGQCIDRLELCDGVVHCTDGSDETAENCIHFECPYYSFRCTYGACVAEKACNGVKNCADNSDELPLRCAANRQQLELELRGNCSENQFMCGSGECIEEETKCDGRLDCVDGSDERFEICSAISCPSYAFQCGYGACVRGAAKCDNVIDCIDGSDEAPQLCKRERNRQGGERTTSSTTTTTTTTSTTARPTKPIPAGGSTFCAIPSDRDNLIYTDFNRNRILQPGETVPLNGIVEYSCPRGYNLEFSSSGPRNFCSQMGWSSEEPKCTRNCSGSPLTHGSSTQVTCFFQNNPVSCNSALLPGTEAILTCAPGFIKPFSFNSYSDTLQCKEQGYWHAARVPCQMECGQRAPKFTTFAKSGVDVDVTDVPWHVGIYNNFNNKTFEHHCGGSIISPRLVLSAAHCFWDGPNAKPFDKSFYSVAAGKYARDYYAKETNFPVQKRAVSQIYIENYSDLNKAYWNDVAVLTLEKPLKFTESIRPVCLNFPEGADGYIQSNLVGSFAGWGITDDNKPAERLQEVIIKTLSYHDCGRRLGKDVNLAVDKFCLVDEYGASACRGDSGAGFVIKKGNIFTLLGIISNAPVKEQDCALNGLVALTNIIHSQNIIKKLSTKEQSEDW